MATNSRHSLLLGCFLCLNATLVAQPIPQNNPNQQNLFGNVANGQNGVNQGLNNGGAAQADFDSLIELIESTVAPNSWENVGGTGSIQGFPGGVYVNAKGVLQKVDTRILQGLRRFHRDQNVALATSDNQDVMKSSKLRKVSLKKLEQTLADRFVKKRSGKAIACSDAEKYLAGITQIDYLLFDDENNDIILAGPAGKWMTDSNGRVVNAANRRPVLQLDDLVVLLRNTFRGVGEFTCSITPKQPNLKAAQEYIQRTTKRPLKPGERDGWLEGLRDSVGNQDIQVQAVPAGSRLARVIVEADYHMKLIGIGLEPGTDGVVSYLDSIEIDKGQQPPPVGVLRWWFTLNDTSVAANRARTVYELKRQSVQVLSENELLTKQGKRVHTGNSNALNREFAASFTRHFSALANRYPIYADLENIFELALVTAVLKQNDVVGRFDWPIRHFLDGDRYSIELRRVPKEVPTVLNHRVIQQKHVVAAVSGGVQVRGKQWLANRTEQKEFNSKKLVARTSSDDIANWWWD